MLLDFSKYSDDMMIELHESLQESKEEFMLKHQTVLDILNAEEQTLFSCIDVQKSNNILNKENIKLVSDMMLQNIEFIEDDEKIDNLDNKRMELLELKA
jgi:hypothetical protein